MTELDSGDPGELDPLHVPHHRDPHSGSLTSRRPSPLEQMMEAVAIPPFESFYAETCDEIWRYLVRLLGRESAEDAFLHYLEKLDQVAHLEVMAVHHQLEKDAAGNPAVDVLHVFARSTGTPM